MKKFFVGVMIVIFGLGGIDIAYAQEVPKVQNNIYIYDGAKILDEGAKKELNTKLSQLEQDTSAEIFVVSVDGLDGQAIEDFGLKVGNDMGVGQAEHNNGMVLVVSPPEGKRNVRIEVGKGMEGIFNDAKVGRILDADFVPYREKGDYATAIVKTVNTLVLETRNNAEWVGKGANNSEDLIMTIVMVGVGLILLIIMFVAIYKTGKMEMKRTGRGGNFWQVIWLGMIIANRNSRRGGNGFGGGGGGGFGGGFGSGGSFGGGGASR